MFHPLCLLSKTSTSVTSTISQSSSHPSPECSELLFSAFSVLPAVAGAGSVKTGSGRAGISVGQAAPSGEQVASHVHVAAAVEPKKCCG